MPALIQAVLTEILRPVGLSFDLDFFVFFAHFCLTGASVLVSELVISAIDCLERLVSE